MVPAVSARVRDLASYRSSVCDAIRRVRASIFLQEDWAESAADVVDLSKRRLLQSDAYIGLFGYRYGSVPDGHNKSVTEIEFDYVMHHWQKEPFPPLFIFLPKADSPAARELQPLADEVLEAEYPNQGERAENKSKQKAFRGYVQGLWRFCRDFSTVGDLREWVIAAIDHYQIQILRNALQEAEAREAAFRAEFSPANLGALDRDPQLRALRRALQGLSRNVAPGMCIVVHGAESYGHTEFLAYLKAWKGWESSAGGRMITPPYDTFAVSSIVTAALSELTSDANVTAGSSEAAFEDLARCILHICKDEPLALFLFGINRLNGGLKALHESFWEPLYAALRRMRDPAPPYRSYPRRSAPSSFPNPACTFRYAPGFPASVA